MTFADIQWDMILGGFGLFLFGIKFMGDGLKSVAGEKLRDYIDKYTSKPIYAVCIGILATIMIQSSSATTAITIGLVRAGLMNLVQAAGIVMGANIGTTVTAFLIGLKVERYALYFVFIGGVLISFAKKKKHRYFGEIILGFGLLFYGLKIMGDSLKMLKDLPEFIAFAETMGRQPLLALFAGTLLTGLIQGSAATIGVVQKLYEAGAMSLSAAIPFIFGSNIGTTVTGVLAAIGGSLAARRTAGIHTLFNVIGTTIGMLALPLYIKIIEWMTVTFNLAPMMQIAMSHILFNLTTTIIFYPFLKQMVDIVKIVIPGNEPEKIDVKVDELDVNIAYELPASALNLAHKAILKMVEVCDKIVDESKDFFFTKGNEEDKEIVMQSESLINNLDKKITDYLMVISKQELTDTESLELNLHLQVIKNLERIGDLTVNLVEFFEMVFEEGSDFSNEARDEIGQMFELFSHMLAKSIRIYETRDYSNYSALMEDENYMDLLEHKSRQKHFDRMANQECTSVIGGSVYCDILGNLERMADHTCNIAKNAIEASYQDTEKDEH